MFLFQVDREINEDKQDRQSDRVREIAIIVVVEMLKKNTFQADKVYRLTNFNPILS